jgi:diguanylate cyclase (GGDEF)-like protein
VRERTRELEAANDAIRNLSLQDELTGLHNRRGFTVAAEQSRRMARRTETDQFLMYVDADGLKQVNDTLGHRAGDLLLQSLANVLRHTFREADVVARIGGDEFCVLGSGSKWDCQCLFERLGAALAAFNVGTAVREFQLRASCGVANWPVRSDVPLEQIVRQADEAMYKAKRAARERIIPRRDCAPAGTAVDPRAG